MKFFEKFLVGVTKFLVNTTGSANQKFRSADQKFSCLNPHHFLVGLTKNEGQPNRNFTSTQLDHYYLVVSTLAKGGKRLQNLYEW